MASSKTPRILKRSMFVRIFAACIVPLICVFVLLAIAIDRVVFNQITASAMETGSIIADEITERINNDHTNVQALLEWVNDSLLAADLSTPEGVEEISDFITTLLTATPYVYCIWFSFEPDVFIPGERLSIDFVEGEDGIIQMFDFDDDSLTDPDLAPWYYFPFTTGEIWFETADFYNYQTGAGYVYTGTVSVPLIKNGEIVGVAGVDTLYQDQFRFVGNRDIENQRRFLLITQEGEIVYSGDNRFITMSIFDKYHGDDEEIYEALNSSTQSVIDGISPFYEVHSVMSFTPVYTEFASQQLYLYIDKPTSTLFRPAAVATQMIVILSALSLLVLGVSLALIISNSLKPITSLTENANRIAAGELDVEVALENEDSDRPVETKNEIELLAIALRKLLIRLRQVQALEIREQTLVAENDMLDRLNRMKTEFFQNMSHDFKTPLTVISVNILDAVHMLDYELSIDELRENLDDAQREIMRMSRMVDSMIKHARGQDTKQDMKPLDIAILLNDGAETYRTLMERNGNVMIVKIPQTLPMVLGSADTLLLVLSNLLSNAYRYTRGGIIAVRAIEKDDMVLVTVQDSGAGIRAELLPHIFERGVSDGGSGLGLSISKSAIEAHGGSLIIESELGKGTAVTFTLPVYREDNDSNRG